MTVKWSTPYCPKCKSTDISLDAVAKWDSVKEQWVPELLPPYGAYIADCDHCGAERIEPVQDILKID